MINVFDFDYEGHRKEHKIAKKPKTQTQKNKPKVKPNPRIILK